MKALLLVWVPALLMGQVEAPRVGCFAVGDRAFDIFGVAGSFVVQPADACAVVENPWRILGGEDGSSWLERADSISGAVEDRRKLPPGHYGVWLDGTLVEFDALGLPAAVAEWRALNGEWMLLRLGGYWALLGVDGRWSYLPGVPE